MMRSSVKMQQKLVKKKKVTNKRKKCAWFKHDYTYTMDTEIRALWGRKHSISGEEKAAGRDE